MAAVNFGSKPAGGVVPPVSSDLLLAQAGAEPPAVKPGAARAPAARTVELHPAERSTDGRVLDRLRGERLVVGAVSAKGGSDSTPGVGGAQLLAQEFRNPVLDWLGDKADAATAATLAALVVALNELGGAMARGSAQAAKQFGVAWDQMTSALSRLGGRVGQLAGALQALSPEQRQVFVQSAAKPIPRRGAAGSSIGAPTPTRATQMPTSPVHHFARAVTISSCCALQRVQRCEGRPMSGAVRAVNLVLVSLLIAACGGGGGGGTDAPTTSPPPVAAAAPLALRLSDPADAAKPDYVKAAATLANGDVVVALLHSDTISADALGATLTGTGIDSGIVVYDHLSGAARTRVSFGGAAQRVVPHGIEVDAGGGFVVIGYAGGPAAGASVDLGAGPVAFRAAEVPFVARFSNAGVLQWGHVLLGSGGSSPGGCANANCDRAWDVALSADGRIVVVGHFSGTLALPQGTLVSRGDTDIFVLVLAADGTQQAAWAIGGPAAEGGRQGAAASPGGLGEMAVAVSAGQLLVQGTFGPDAEFGGTGPSLRRTPANGVRDVFIARYGLDGRLDSSTAIWQAGAPADAASAFAAPGAMRTDAQGQLYFSLRQRLAGQTYSGCAALPTAAERMMTLSLDAGLRCRWTRVFDFSGGGVHRTLHDGRGSVFMAGWFGGTHVFPNQTLSARSTRSDVFLARLDATSGAPVWGAGLISVAPADAGNIAAGLAIDGQGHPWIGGQFFTAIEAAQPGQTSVVLRPAFSGAPAGDTGDAFLARFDFNDGRLR